MSFINESLFFLFFANVIHNGVAVIYIEVTVTCK